MNNAPPLTGNVYTPATGQWHQESHSPPPQQPIPDPIRPHSGGASEDRLTRLWSLQSRLQIFGSLYGTIESQLPTFTHTIAVSVIGGPKSDMRRIWQLCLSTAFGRYRQAGRTGLQAGQLDATWDITGKSCQVIISYVNSGIEGALAGAGIGLKTALANNPLGTAGAVAIPGGLGVGVVAGANVATVGDFLYQGPTQETVGGDTLSWLNVDGVLANAAVTGGIGGAAGAVVGGILTRSITGVKKGAELGVITGAVLGAATGAIVASIQNRPALPDSNRVITTANKVNPNVQPPKPSGDGVSRTFPYLALVANALNSPCYLPASPPKGAQLDVTTPVYYGDPSKPYDKANINNTVNGYIVNIPVNTDAVIGAAGGLIAGIQFISKDRKDGYPLLPDKTIVNLQGPTNPGSQ